MRTQFDRPPRIAAEIDASKASPSRGFERSENNPRGSIEEENADAHMKRQIMGREVVVAITKGKLDFGPLEQIFYGEFDGPRRKRA